MNGRLIVDKVSYKCVNLLNCIWKKKINAIANDSIQSVYACHEGDKNKGSHGVVSTNTWLCGVVTNWRVSSVSFVTSQRAISRSECLRSEKWTKPNRYRVDFYHLCEFTDWWHPVYWHFETSIDKGPLHYFYYHPVTILLAFFGRIY